MEVGGAKSKTTNHMAASIMVSYFFGKGLLSDCLELRGGPKNGLGSWLTLFEAWYPTPLSLDTRF